MHGKTKIRITMPGAALAIPLYISMFAKGDKGIALNQNRKATVNQITENHHPALLIHWRTQILQQLQQHPQQPQRLQATHLYFRQNCKSSWLYFQWNSFKFGNLTSLFIFFINTKKYVPHFVGLPFFLCIWFIHASRFLIPPSKNDEIIQSESKF